MTHGFPFKLAAGEFGPMRRAQSSATKLSLTVKLAPLALKWGLGARRPAPFPNPAEGHSPSA